MNLYFLVEGRRTEKKVYPQWLGHLIPELTRVARYDQVDKNNYFIFSGQGYPSLLHNHLKNAIKDIHASGRYSHLVLCLDADEFSIDARKAEVSAFLRDNNISLRGAELRIIVQNRCFETWFLGNRKIIPRTPQSPRMREFLYFYDVRKFDPETMGCLPGFDNHAQFHVTYLQEVFAERDLAYSKISPGPVATQQYLSELVMRTQTSPSHLLSFQEFLQFCEMIRSAISSSIN